MALFSMVSEEILIGLVGGLGIGTLITSIANYYLENKKQIKIYEQETKRERYKALVIKMLVVLDPTNQKYVLPIRPDLKTLEDWRKEVEAEWFNSWLFASDEVIKQLKSFLNQPSTENYCKTVIAIRKDLWGKETNLTPEDFKI